jgi:hypothetical protein
MTLVGSGLFSDSCKEFRGRTTIAMFGSPRVFSRKASYCEQLANADIHLVVFDGDPVPRLLGNDLSNLIMPLAAVGIDLAGIHNVAKDYVHPDNLKIAYIRDDAVRFFPKTKEAEVLELGFNIDLSFAAHSLSNSYLPALKSSLKGAKARGGGKGHGKRGEARGKGKSFGKGGYARNQRKGYGRKGKSFGKKGYARNQRKGYGRNSIKHK